MSILMGRLPEARILDLFSGSGALGLEALSRGASHVTFVERSRGAIRVLERNVDQLEAGELVRIVHGDAMTSLPRWEDGAEPPFDIALADPPYDKGYAAMLLERFSRAPFARELWVEHRTAEDLGLEALSALEPEQRRYGDTALTGVFHPVTGANSE